RPEQREELTVRDREAHILDRARRAEALGDLVEAYARHGTTPSGRLRPRRPARPASASVTATEMVPTAAAAGELPSYCRKNTTTPPVSRPLDQRSADTVSSLNVVMKMSKAPAAADGATTGRITAASRRSTPAPATCAASSRLRLTRSIP